MTEIQNERETATQRWKDRWRERERDKHRHKKTERERTGNFFFNHNVVISIWEHVHFYARCYLAQMYGRSTIDLIDTLREEAGKLLVVEDFQVTPCKKKKKGYIHPVKQGQNGQRSEVIDKEEKQFFVIQIKFYNLFFWMM